jgi:MoaA/NifB/PqqE/SkfB family radical SAM enzyme
VQGQPEAFVDEQGRLVLPAEVAARQGLRPGETAALTEQTGGLTVRRAASSLAKLYIEPTNICNLACRTCVRNIWDESLGKMDEATFAAILAGLEQLTPRPSVFFGGFGEPFSHPGILDMVARVKALGCYTEMITNGTLLTEARAHDLIDLGLDRLWVSLDGARPESYTDVRLGAALPMVLKNVRRFSDLRPPRHPRRPELGIAFVAMRRNIADLPAVLSLGSTLGASQYLVTNVMPYTAEMRSELLYTRALNDIAYLPSPWTPHLDLPKMDFNEVTAPVLYEALRSNRSITFAGAALGDTNNRCPFIEAGAGVVGWDGSLTPCLPLLHDHTSYLNNRTRTSRRYIVGRLPEKSLTELWYEPEHLEFRRRVQAFDFSPCTFCGGCDCSLSNEEDCFGNPYPTCGGCLWAQGIIRCP